MYRRVQFLIDCVPGPTTSCSIQNGLGIGWIMYVNGQSSISSVRIVWPMWRQRRRLIGGSDDKL